MNVSVDVTAVANLSRLFRSDLATAQSGSAASGSRQSCPFHRRWDDQHRRIAGHGIRLQSSASNTSSANTRETESEDAVVGQSGATAVAREDEEAKGIRFEPL